jgi:hypothetical protein
MFTTRYKRAGAGIIVIGVTGIIDTAGDIGIYIYGKNK